MLSEARARLANTRGKKAKRKAREKQLEESRRLAALQKRRELKAAGVELGTGKRKQRGVDYGNEVPFQKVPPAGFFDTVGEDAAAEAVIAVQGSFNAVLKSKLDAPNRDHAEANARKADAEKLKRKKDEALPEAVAQLNRLNDASVAKRARLMLPPPQVMERELESVVKASAQHVHASQGAGATHMLSSSYQQTPGGVAARTPRVGVSGIDTILEEAAAQAAMLERDTPLVGGESVPIESLGSFGGVVPHLEATVPLNTSTTPCNPVGRQCATPSAVSTAGGYFAASGKVGVGASGGSRDALGINEPPPIYEGSQAGILSPVASKRLGCERRAAICAQLSMLPAPINEYTIVLPGMSPVEPPEDGSTPMEADALETAESEQRAASVATALECSQRSSSVQRELPRPLIVNRDFTAAAVAPLHVGAGAADMILGGEMLDLLEADASTFPLQGRPVVDLCKPVSLLGAEARETAAMLIADEFKAWRGRGGFRDRGVGSDAHARMWAVAYAELGYVPSLQKYAVLSSVDVPARASVMQQSYRLLRNFMVRDGKKATKLEKKLDLSLGGYRKRSSTVSASLATQQFLLREKMLERACSERLESYESLIRPQRLAVMESLLADQAAREAELQAHYAKLSRTRTSLEQALQGLRRLCG